jgi:hypothetical protein
MYVQNITMPARWLPLSLSVVRWPRSWAGAWARPWVWGIGWLLLLGCRVSGAAAPVGAGAAVEWLGKSRLTPASIEAARKHLGESDVFTQAMSRFDRESRLRRGDDPSDAEFRRFAAAQAREWKGEHWERVVRACEALRSRLDVVPILPWPRETLFITTTGQEEGDAAYCRGAAVILPESAFQRSQERLERLVAHELFHVLSNQNPEWRKRVYAVIGFVPCPDVSLPVTLRDRKITNPDGPLADCRIELEVAGRKAHFAPVLLATSDRYDVAKGGSFFPYLKFQLLEVESAEEGRWQAVERDGRPVLLDPKATPEYGRKIGANTNYVIHPDETLADNFVHLVFRTPDLPNPEIIERLRAALR